MAHKITIGAVLAGAAGCLIMAVVNAVSLNSPQAAGIISREGAIYVGLWLAGAIGLAMVAGGHGLFLGLRSYLAGASPRAQPVLTDSTKATLAAIAEHMRAAASVGDTATVKTLTKAEDTILKGAK